MPSQMCLADWFSLILTEHNDCTNMFKSISWIPFWNVTYSNKRTKPFLLTGQSTLCITTHFWSFKNKFHQKTSLLHLWRMCSVENSVDKPFFSQSNLSYTYMVLHLRQSYMHLPIWFTVSLNNHLNLDSSVYWRTQKLSPSSRHWKKHRFLLQPSRNEALFATV